SASPMPCAPPVTMATLSLRRTVFPLSFADDGSLSRSGGRRHPARPLDELRDLPDALAGPDIGEDERSLGAHPARVAIHHLEIGPDKRREVDLIDHEQIAARDPRSTLAGDLVTRRDVDD